MRLEAEFYTSLGTIYKNSIRAEDIVEFSQYGTSKELNELGTGYPVLRLNEFDSSFITAPAKFCSLLSKDSYMSLKLKKDDVLICRTNGNPKLVGKCALVPKDYDYAFASYLYRIRPDKSIINSATLVAFLNSKYGRKEIEKYSMLSNQANFSPAKFREILIPIFTPSFNANIENLTYNAFYKREQANSLFNDAEKILLDYLGIEEAENPTPAVKVKSLRESFSSSGRLDAEYYMPKYEALYASIASLDCGYEQLKDICDIKDANLVPIEDAIYRYIELADIGSDGEIKGFTQNEGKNLPNRARRIVHTGDVIVSSVEGSLDSCALISEEYDSSLCSTGFYVVSSNIINSETLLMLFKSSFIKNLMKKGCSGSILSAISKQEFEIVPLPIISITIQQEISKTVQESFRLRKESLLLLQQAKDLVESEIEKLQLPS